HHVERDEVDAEQRALRRDRREQRSPHAVGASESTVDVPPADPHARQEAQGHESRHAPVADGDEELGLRASRDPSPLARRRSRRHGVERKRVECARRLFAERRRYELCLRRRRRDGHDPLLGRGAAGVAVEACSRRVKSSALRGGLMKYPCRYWHPRETRNSAWSWLSTPTATHSSRRAPAMATIAVDNAASRESVNTLWTKDRSILTRSIGSRVRQLSDEYPVPKSSTAMRNPFARSARIVA